MCLRKRKLMRNKKGISPVIATVVIVAVTIAIAIAIAFWMLGLVNISTRIEKIEISSAYATYANGVYTVTLSFKNTGPAAASISDVFINGIPASTYYADGQGVTKALVTTVSYPTGSDFATKVGGTNGPVLCQVGDAGVLTLTGTVASNPPNGNPFVNGVSLEIRLHTAAGKDYPQVIVLP
jgi:flagellin-like protein